MDLGRREFLAGVASLGVGVAQDVEVRELKLPGTFSKRATLVLPNHLGPRDQVPLLVLLHGLAETVDPRLGAYAWVERYGLTSAYDRLRRPPVARIGKRRDITDGDLAEINRTLASKPFRGLAMVCPYLPKGPSLDDMTAFVVDIVVPEARRASALIAKDTDIDGCSLGGYLSLEIFLRRPTAFAAWGGVQSAIGAASAPRYAERIAGALARTGKRALHIETSEGDAFRQGNEALSRELSRRGIEHTFRMLPGPHDQPWLREAGTLEMLLWHAQR